MLHRITLDTELQLLLAVSILHLWQPLLQLLLTLFVAVVAALVLAAAGIGLCSQDRFGIGLCSQDKLYSQ
jgi:hypothetical protein